MEGQHSARDLQSGPPLTKLSVPIEFPSKVLNRYTCKAFNELYYYANKRREGTIVMPYEPYFYPLDKVSTWNRIYGKRGFFQYQALVPVSEKAAFGEIFEQIANSGLASFLAVLKKFGDVESPGMLSFPREGYTLTLDFSNRPGVTIPLLRRLTSIVNEANGRLYPAKDSVMTPEDFQLYYPNWQDFAKYKDPLFSSSFWRRVTEG